MSRCPACGAELKEKLRYCPHCGNPFPEGEKLPVRDFWAERLSMQNSEDSDWTEEPEEDELLDLDEDVPWVGPELDVQPPPPRKRRWPLAVLTGILVVACIIMGFVIKKYQSQIPIPGSGMYYGVYCILDREPLDTSGDWAELRSDRSFRLMVVQGYAEGSWCLNGSEFYAHTDCGPIYGTLKDGVLRIRWRHVTYVLALSEKKDQVRIPEKKVLSPTFPPEESPYYAWNGEYYGCMIQLNGTGDWEYENQAVDVCGRIEVLPEDLGRVSLWSPDNKPGERFCMADVLFKEGTTEQGQMQLEWGMFYDMEMRPGEWAVDPGRSMVSHLPGMLCIRGTFLSPSDPLSSFEYLIFLRPWGAKWEDIENMPEEQLPCTGMLPPGYRSWYLPLVNAGRLMPESF